MEHSDTQPVNTTKRTFQDPCEVCEQNKSKYRCPKCRILYCSVDCKNSHQCKEATVHVQPRERTESHDAGILDDEFRISRRALERIKNSESLVAKLKSERLREIILAIDSSDSKLKQLNHEMQYNKDFNEFIYEMLKEVGYVDENGQFTG